MKDLIKRKNAISNIILAIGAVLLVYSIYVYMDLKFFQEKEIEEYNVSVEEEVPIVDLNEKLSSEKDSKGNNGEKSSSIDRKSIEDLKMIIEIPKIKLNAAVVNGTTSNYLKKGPGLYEISPLPTDKDANVLIAGHRTTYGAWFKKVDKLDIDDDIFLKFERKNYNYKVEKVFIIEKNDWSVTEHTGYNSLTLTSCHPPGSSRQRIVVRARLYNIRDE